MINVIDMLLRLTLSVVCRSSVVPFVLSAALSTQVFAAPIEVVEAEPDVVNSPSSVRYTTRSVGQDNGVSESADLRVSTDRVASNSSGNISAEIYVQLQQLQAEVQALRGLVEEQSYQIQQLSQKRLEDYIDLDRRIGELQKNSMATSGSANTRVVNTVTPTQPKVSVPAAARATSTITTATARLSNVGSSDSVAAAPPQPSSAREAKAAYQGAYQRIKQSDFALAKVELKAFIEAYPDSAEVPKAHFWLGELYYVESDLKNSEAAFSSLLEGFPQHRKVPEAKFKLGKIYHQQGQTEKAKAMLNSVLKDYPNSKAANPASEYLKNSLR